MGLLPLAPEASASASSATSAVEFSRGRNGHYNLPSGAARRRRTRQRRRYNWTMHLSVARLCLDCQEIHDADRCPVCTSEAFGFITRWVTVDPAPRHIPSKNKRADASRIDGYRQILNPQLRGSRTARWLRRGGILMAAGYLARWGWIAAQQKRTAQRPSAGDN